MSSLLRTIAPRRAAFASSRLSQTTSSFTLQRTYANEPSHSATTRGTPNASNIHPSPSSSGEASQVNSKRGVESEAAETKPTTATPVSHPEQSGLGAQEEAQPSQENVRRPKEEPEDVKREHVEREGQKKLDAADDGISVAKRDPTK